MLPTRRKSIPQADMAPEWEVRSANGLVLDEGGATYDAID